VLGNHLIIDIYDVPNRGLIDKEYFEGVLTKAVLDAGAKILMKFFHSFGEDFGFTGVICLKESHVSIHTWPEHSYAAVDVFMCGEADAWKVARHLMTVMPTSKFKISAQPRG
jgi:S-adenosylmethionine decarboxylase